MSPIAALRRFIVDPSPQREERNSTNSSFHASGSYRRGIAIGMKQFSTSVLNAIKRFWSCHSAVPGIDAFAGRVIEAFGSIRTIAAVRRLIQMRDRPSQFIGLPHSCLAEKRLWLGGRPDDST